MLVTLRLYISPHFFFLSMLSQKHKWSWPWPTLKQQANFTAFYGRFMMSAARLTAGMLTQSYQWHLHLQGRDRPPTHTRTPRTHTAQKPCV